MKIGYRLGIGFAIILILTGLLGFVAQSNVNALWRLTENLHRHPFTVTKAVRDIRTNIIAMQRSMKDVALATDDDELRAAKAKVDELERRVFKSFDIVFDRFLGDMSDVQDAYDTFVNWKPIRDEVIQLYLNGKKDAAAAITKGKGARYIANLDRKIRKMMDFADQKAQSYYTDAQTIKNKTIRNSTIILFAIGLFSLLVAVVITRSITKPLISMLGKSKKFSEGDYSIRNTNLTSDEAGMLAKSINELADSIELRITVQKGIADISKSMTGCSTLSEFGRALLKQLLESTRANMSAFYILNETTASYEHLVSIGANQELLKPFSAGNPEGEFGKAVATKKLSYLKGIPEDTVFKFITTAGNIIPKEIITIPISMENTVVALISLVGIHPFKAESMDIIKHSLSTIKASYSELLAIERTRVLAESLIRTNQQLEAQTEELQSQTEELQQQTEELEESNIELEHQRKEVEKANRLKSEFLSNMSHELRTPLSSILSLSRVVINQARGKLTSKQTHYLEIVERNGRQLLQLINDILDLSRIEAGYIDLNPTAFSIKGIINTVIENLSVLAKDKELKFSVDIPANLPELVSDETKVHQILLNMIGNAVKFTESGAVTVAARSAEKQIMITVKDTGIGIAEENLGSIFEEFRQVEASSSRSYEGTGLGLAIARKSARIMGGDITVESKPGKGSAFTLSLPLKWTGPSFETEPATTALPVATEAVIRPSPRQRILLVDDQEAVIIQVCSMLESTGYNVDVTRGGREALNYLRHTIPAGIILDLMMPEMDGFDVLAKIRSTAATAKVPVLILTAKDLSTDDLSRLKSNNIQQLIQKGDVDKKQLLIKIQMLLETGQTLIAPVVGDNKTDKLRVPGKKAPGEKPTVLIVEDNPDNLASLKALLEGKYTLLEARDGKQGLEKVLEHLPALVILDIMLPKMDGYEVVKRIKADKNARDIPVIALTARAMESNRERILAAGCDDYLTKPVEQKIILAKLEKWLGA